jgi:hypothetical protein
MEPQVSEAVNCDHHLIVMLHSISDLEEALDVVAEVIELYGDAYWPIFDRLEEELETRQGRKERLRQRRKDRSVDRGSQNFEAR